MNIKVTLLVLIILSLKSTDYSTQAKPTYNGRSKTDPGSRMLEEMPHIARQTIEETEKAKNGCPSGKFYSFNTKVCESCEKHCPNGTDVTLCGQQCVDYYMNKSLSEAQQHQGNRINKNEAALLDLQKKYALHVDQDNEKDEAIKDKIDSVVAELELRFSEKIKDVTDNQNNSNQTSIIMYIAYGFLILLLFAVIGLLAYFGKKCIDKNLHLKSHGTAATSDSDQSLSSNSTTGTGAATPLIPAVDGNQNAEARNSRTFDHRREDPGIVEGQVNG